MSEVNNYFDEVEKLIESVSEQPIVECGYDLSFVQPSDLEEFFNRWGIPTGSATREDEKYCYTFTNYESDTIELRMGAHPFANGLLFNTKQGTRGQGYCSYIGVKGPEKFVDEFKALMSKNDCKDYSDTPDFI